MQTKAARMREIVKQDNARRQARLAMEDAILGLGLVDPLSDANKIAENTKPGTYVNPCLVRGIGTVNPPVHTSASRNTWDRGMRGRVVGVAPGTEDTAIEATVAVTRDGVTEIVPVSAFRGKRSKRSTTHKRTTTAAPQHPHTTAADLPSIRQGESY